MYVLTPENTRYNVTAESMTESTERHYGTLYYPITQDEDQPDYFFSSLYFFDEIRQPVAVLNIGGNTVEVPYGWYILVCDKHIGIIEPILISDLNGRTFDTWGFNHINGYTPIFHQVQLVEVLPEATFYMPRLRNHHYLTVPINDKKSPDCVYIIGTNNKVPEQLDITTLI